MLRPVVSFLLSGCIAVTLSACSLGGAGRTGTGSAAVGLDGPPKATPSPAPSPSAIPVLANESAFSSAAFVDSIGEQAGAALEEPKYTQLQVRSLIGNLGVRHYRVSAAEILPGSAYLSTLTDLFNSFGYKFDVLSNITMSAQQVVQATELLPAGSVDSVEGPSEPDVPSQNTFYDPNFAADIPPFMQALYDTVNSTPATTGLSVVGPSFAGTTSYAAVGNISNALNEGNMHNYFGGFNPGTSGWGKSGYAFAPSLRFGSIQWNIASAGQVSGSKPIISTETGYCIAVNLHGCVPVDVLTKYVPRLYLEEYRDNVPRTYLYELVGTDTTTQPGTLELVSPSGAPNSAYYALAGLISLLYDGGAQTSPRTYRWALTGQTTDVHHVLMHKADGTLIVALWIEGKSFDPNAEGGRGAKIPIPLQDIVVTLAQSAGSGTVWTCNLSTGTWSSQRVPISSGSVSLKLSDSVSLLEIKP